MRIWSTADWKMLREVKIKTSDAWAVSPGSHYLLGPRDADEEGNTVSFQVIDTLTNEEVARITANRVRATAFGHDGRNIAIGSYPALSYGRSWSRQRQRAHRRRTRDRCHSLQRR